MLDSIKLFVDDIRKCPKGWTGARTVTEAIRILSTEDVTEVSLDHDIQCDIKMGIPHASSETFEAVAWFVKIHNDFNSQMCGCSYHDGYSSDKTTCPRIIKVRIHTSNFIKGRKMAEILDVEYIPYFYNKADYE